MRGGLIAACLTLVCLPLSAQQNLVPNGDFSAGLEGWEVSRAGTEPALDTEDFHSAPVALLLRPTAPRVGVKGPDHQFAEPLPTVLAVSGWLKADNAVAGANAGFDLKIVLDDGSTTWFMPAALVAQPGEAGRWVLKRSSYTAPPGRSIAAMAAYCLNYGSGGDARFDDFTVYALSVPEAKHQVAVLFAETPDEPGVQSVSAALTAAGIEHDLMPTAAEPRDFRLVIAPTWVEDDGFYLRLKVAHYLGGRVVLADLPATRWARAISQYFWDLHSSDLPDAALVSEDGRAAHIKSGSWRPEQVAALVRDTLATDIALPDEVPALDFGPKPPITLRGSSLYVGEEPFLFRGVYAYRLNPEIPIEQHSAMFEHYAELRLNGLLIYISYDAPLDFVQQVFDAAHEHGLRLMLWVYGPPASPWSEKPLKDEWLLRLLPLREHPAVLGWIMCDDTFHRYLPFLERTSEVLRRYDQANLVTTTLMDPRNPANVPEEGWARWRELLDFPLVYLYPLQKGRSFGGGADIAGGLEDVQRLAENTRTVWGGPVYIQQACQAHMQGHARDKLAMPARAVSVPTCEQQRLLTFMMLAADTRGIGYFSAGGLEDSSLGTGRRAELGLLWGELEPVQDIIGGGEIAQCQTSQPDVEAVSFSYGSEAVILALKHGAEYHRFVDETALVRDVSITLPEAVPGAAACYLLDGPVPTELALSADRRSITLPVLDVTAAVLVSADPERLAALRAQREAWTELAARLALSAAADTGAKTRVVAERIAAMVGGEFGALQAEGDRLFALAVEQHRDGHSGEAYRIAREALRPWRHAQATAIRWAEAEHQRQGLAEDALIWLNIYPALPRFVELYCGGPPYDPAAMCQEVLDILAEYQFLVREPAPLP